jgi:hypothetical protein
MPVPTFNPIEACETTCASMPNRPRLEHGATTAIIVAAAAAQKATDYILHRQDGTDP